MSRAGASTTRVLVLPKIINMSKNIVLQYYLCTDFPVLILISSVLAPALVMSKVQFSNSNIIQNSNLSTCCEIAVRWMLQSRAETIRSAHDTIRCTIRCTQYDTFRDTFAILTWEAEACDPGLRSEVLHSTDYNCLRSNDAQWLQQWRPPQSFKMQCVCDEFTHFIGIYWLFSVVSRVRF